MESGACGKFFFQYNVESEHDSSYSYERPVQSNDVCVYTAGVRSRALQQSSAAQQLPYQAGHVRPWSEALAFGFKLLKTTVTAI